MATTYAAYHDLVTSNNSSRKSSSTSASSGVSTKSKTQKVMDFFAPRIPLNEPLTPTAVANKQQQERREREETEYAPARIYDPVLRRPLFQKAKKGNEITMTQRRLLESKSRKPSVSESVDRVYNVHLSGAEYFKVDEKK